MRLLLQLRWWKAGDRISSALICLVTVTLLLGGCWPVAAPLIGVGVVGGGAAVATTLRTKPDSSPTAAQQEDEVDAAPVSQTKNWPVPDRASEPVAAALPTSTPAASPSPAAAPKEASRRTPGRPSAEVVAESSRPKPPKNARPVAVVTPSLAVPDDLPPTMIVH